MAARRLAGALLLVLVAAAHDRPIMGWSTWNAYSCSINETVLAATVDAMVSLQLVSAGYTGIHIDDCSIAGRDAQGNLIPDPAVFPSGFQHTVDKIRGAGMQLGMYTARGNVTCEGRPGILGHEAQDAAWYAAQNVTYLKFDSCGEYGNRTAFDQYRIINDALRAAWAAVGTPPPFVEVCELLQPGIYPRTLAGGRIAHRERRQQLLDRVRQHGGRLAHADVDAGRRGAAHLRRPPLRPGPVQLHGYAHALLRRHEPH